LCEYWPVRIDAREGAQRGRGAYALVKLRPWFARSSGRRGISLAVGTSKSSATTTIRFGRNRGGGDWAGTGAAGDPPPQATSIATTDATLPTPAVVPGLMTRQSRQRGRRASRPRRLHRLHKVEKGEPDVFVGAYATVRFVLGMVERHTW
jgi:hypothetical protein